MLVNFVSYTTFFCICKIFLYMQDFFCISKFFFCLCKIFLYMQDFFCISKIFFCLCKIFLYMQDFFVHYGSIHIKNCTNVEIWFFDRDSPLCRFLCGFLCGFNTYKACFCLQKPSYQTLMVNWSIFRECMNSPKRMTCLQEGLEGILRVRRFLRVKKWSSFLNIAAKNPVPWWKAMDYFYYAHHIINCQFNVLKFINKNRLSLQKHDLWSTWPVFC